MRTVFVLLIALCGHTCFANMASPITRGTGLASACSSMDIDIHHEVIYVTVGSNFKSATFDVAYDVYADKDGMQIPLLFYAVHYGTGFKVWVDSTETSLLDIPAEVQHTANTPFFGFTRYFSCPDSNDHLDYDYMKMQMGTYGNSRIALKDFKYFKAILSKGAHKIRVVYVADPWIDRGGTIDEFSFQYSLSPARYWRSFGTLTVVLNSLALSKPISVNLGAPASGNTDSVAMWNFTSLPKDDFILITYVPVMPYLAHLLLSGEVGIIITLWVLLLSMHVLLIWRYRKKETQEKRPWAIVFATVIIPVVLLTIQLVFTDLRLILLSCVLVALGCICFFDFATRGFKQNELRKIMPFTLLAGSIIMSILLIAIPLSIRVMIYAIIGNGHSDYMAGMLFVFTPFLAAVYYGFMLLLDWQIRKRAKKNI